MLRYAMRDGALAIRPQTVTSHLEGLPNMRLKLSGLSFSNESECCALARTNCRSTPVRSAGTSPAA